jgi:hypothetical protein
VELNPEFSVERFKDRDTTIDPDASVYGVKFGSTESEVMAAFGDPTGVIVISDTKKGFLYGKSHLFIFRKGKLKQLTVSSSILDWTVSQQMDGHPFFDRNMWSITPSIRNEMSFGEVMKALDKPEVAPEYRHVIDGELSSTTLQFAGWRGDSGAQEFKLHGFSIVYYGN